MHGMSRYKWAAVAALLTSAFQIWVCRPIISDYVPTNDEIVLEAASTSLGGGFSPVRWVTEGYHSYFRPYPEWGFHSTDFWRPLTNGLFWADYQLFGTHWGNQLLFAYLMHGLVVGLTAYFASRILRLRLPFVLLAVLLAALNPALWSRYASSHAISNVVQFPTFQTEIVCAMVMFIGMLLFIRRQFVLFAVLLSAAVCFKETALTVPVSALVLTGAWLTPDQRKSLKNFALLATPLAVWGVAKIFVFKYGALTYPLVQTSRSGMFLQPIRNLLLWPTGLYVGPLKATILAVNSHDWGKIAEHATALMINTGWWVLFAVAVIALLRSSAGQWFTKPPQIWAIALVFAAGNLALAILLQVTQLRFGYFWFAVGPAALFVVLSRWAYGSLAATVLTAGIIIQQILTIGDSFSEQSLEVYRVIKQSARQLTQLLGSLPSTVTTVYVVDDVWIQPAGPEYLAKISGFHGHLVMIDSIDRVSGCSPVDNGQARYRLVRDGGTMTLNYLSPPSCFEWSWYVAPVGALESAIRNGTDVPRGPWLSYSFPQLNVRSRTLMTDKADYAVGDHWTVRTTDPACARQGACVWLGLDRSSHRYYVLPESSPESSARG